VLRVADTGIGIADEHRERVFERFFRADPARSPGGSGLGLAIVRWLVERHGGSVAASGRLGEGAEFVVRLPRSRRAALWPGTVTSPQTGPI
jgi:signal transduction histidine kinase